MFIVFYLMLLCSIIAYILRVCELPLLVSLNENDFRNLTVFFNAYYATFLTITTVGYGSSYTRAQSVAGRLVLMFTTFLGTILISLTVMVSNQWI
jgi:hypothetical protein